MQIATVIAERSKDPSTQAGAVIVDEARIMVGIGYNGWPRGAKEEDFPWEREGLFFDTKYAYVVHAEENAIYNANKSVHGCTLYSTLFPCNECAKAIVQCGIREVKYASDKYHDKDAWRASRRILDAAGVRYLEYVPQFKIRFEPQAQKHS